MKTYRQAHFDQTLPLDHDQSADLIRDAIMNMTCEEMRVFVAAGVAALEDMKDVVPWKSARLC